RPAAAPGVGAALWPGPGSGGRGLFGGEPMVGGLAGPRPRPAAARPPLGQRVASSVLALHGPVMCVAGPAVVRGSGGGRAAGRRGSESGACTRRRDAQRARKYATGLYPREARRTRGRAVTAHRRLITVSWPRSARCVTLACLLCRRCLSAVGARGGGAGHDSGSGPPDGDVCQRLVGC